MNLKDWKPNFVKGTHFSMTIIAPRRQGKSYFIKDIFEKNDFNRMFDLHVVFSQSLSNAMDVDFYANFVPGSWQYDKPEDIPTVMQKIFDLQKDSMEKFGRYYNILIIFDDMVSLKQKYNNEILQAYIRGRNSGLSIIMTAQTPALLSKDWRTNSDYAVLFFDKDVDNRKKNIDNFIKSLWEGKIDQSKSKLYQEVDVFYLNITKTPHQALICDFIDNKMYKYTAS